MENMTIPYHAPHNKWELIDELCSRFDIPISQAVKLLRKGRAITQQGLADMLGVSRRSVVGWESGRNLVPGPILFACKMMSPSPRLSELFEQELVTRRHQRSNGKPKEHQLGEPA